LAEAKRVLEGIGGVPYKNGWGYDFDYDPKPVLDDIVCSGCIPDQKTHQYYPTRELVATDAVERAQVGPSDECCEPSAGQGGIADYMPKGRTRCVEISDLHCKILEAKGHNVVKADFIEWAATTNERFDVIVMNPPFSEGRAMLHLKAAMSLLRPGGRFSAVLPASLKNSDIAPGWNVEWSDVYSDEFAGTGVSVIIACGNRP
jgi:hypothetical protein